MTTKDEQLTDDERAYMNPGFPDSTTAKALRIIDAHAADRAALVAQLEAAKAEVERLRAVIMVQEEPDSCARCDTVMDGNAAATGDICHDCWQSLETHAGNARKLAAAVEAKHSAESQVAELTRERDEVRRQLELTNNPVCYCLKSEESDCPTRAAGLCPRARMPACPVCDDPIDADHVTPCMPCHERPRLTHKQLESEVTRLPEALAAAEQDRDNAKQDAEDASDTPVSDARVLRAAGALSSDDIEYLRGANGDRLVLLADAIEERQGFGEFAASTFSEDQLTEIRMRMRAAESECAALRAQLNELETNAFHRETRIRGLRAEVERLRAELTDSDGHLKALHDEFDRAEAGHAGPDGEADPDYPPHARHFAQPVTAPCEHSSRRAFIEQAAIAFATHPQYNEGRDGSGAYVMLPYLLNPSDAVKEAVALWDALQKGAS